MSFKNYARLISMNLGSFKVATIYAGQEHFLLVCLVYMCAFGESKT